MSEIDMSDLIGMILSQDDSTSLHVREHWPLHTALRGVYECLRLDAHLLARWEAHGLPALQLTRDEEVVMRTRGITAALWRLAERGDLKIEDDEWGPRFKPTPGYYAKGRRRLLRFDPELARVIQRAGQRLAACTTASSK
jgi:hypothetical protein